MPIGGRDSCRCLPKMLLRSGGLSEGICADAKSKYMMTGWSIDKKVDQSQQLFSLFLLFFSSFLLFLSFSSSSSLLSCFLSTLFSYSLYLPLASLPLFSLLPLRVSCPADLLSNPFLPFFLHLLFLSYCSFYFLFFLPPFLLILLPILFHAFSSSHVPPPPPSPYSTIDPTLSPVFLPFPLPLFLYLLPTLSSDLSPSPLPVPVLGSSSSCLPPLTLTDKAFSRSQFIDRFSSDQQPPTESNERRRRRR